MMKYKLIKFCTFPSIISIKKSKQYFTFKNTLNHGIYIYMVPTFTQYLHLHCTYIYTVPTFTQYLHLHCT